MAQLRAQQTCKSTLLSGALMAVRCRC